MQWLGPWYGTACSSDWLSFSFSRKYFWTIWGPISSKNTFSNHGMQLKIQNKYFQCCISRTHWVLLMGMAVSCRKSIIFRKSKGQRQFSFSASQKQSLFSASLKQCFFLASVSQVPPSYFQCLSRGSKPSNILEYSLFVNIAIIILDDVIEAYNLSQFCQF